MIHSKLSSEISSEKVTHKNYKKIDSFSRKRRNRIKDGLRARGHFEIDKFEELS